MIEEVALNIIIMLRLIHFNKLSLSGENTFRSITGGAIKTCTEEYNCKDSLLRDGTTVWPQADPCSDEHAECDANC